MTLDANILEHPACDAPRAADPRIARAERWLFMLRLLTDVGMWIVRALIRQAAPTPHDLKWTGPRIAFPSGSNPITIFVRLARAVRLAVALKMKIEREIADLRAGKSVSPVAPAAQAPPQDATAADLADDKEVEEPKDVEDVEDLKDSERPEILPREAKTPFRESDRFCRLLNGPLKDAVAAICADLGLQPDWSQWTEDGFPPPERGDVRDWGIFLAPESDTPPSPERDDGGHDSGDDGDPIVWRPCWRRPRRRKPKAPLDPRYDRGPATWRDFNDFQYNDVLKGDSHGL